MEEAGIFTMHRCPRAPRPKEQEVTRWPVRVLSAVTTMMGSPSDPCRGPSPPRWPKELGSGWFP